ncbi:unnamed protein product [Paramecium sonneborni]|uniref:Transmembrane protein n=1 Tax=Paramecium sonneborni TaxID=65129 RepID=A0A8S1KTR5_9CILI|nr:unnamed protein product [Paramecium sonneborni]
MTFQIHYFQIASKKIGKFFIRKLCLQYNLYISEIIRFIIIIIICIIRINAQFSAFSDRIYIQKFSNQNSLIYKYTFSKNKKMTEQLNNQTQITLMTERYNEQYEINKETEIKMQKGLKKDLTDCVTKVVGEVAMKVCFALTVAFCVGC